MVFFAVTGLGLCVSLMEVAGITDPAQTPLAKLGSGLLLLALLLAYMGVGYWVSTASPRRSSKALFVLVAYFSQLAPWSSSAGPPSHTTISPPSCSSVLPWPMSSTTFWSWVPPRSRRLPTPCPAWARGLYAAF